jgi:hypothetical protein
MRNLGLVIATVAICVAVVCNGQESGVGIGDYRVIAVGFSWAENLAFDGHVTNNPCHKSSLPIVE